MSAKDDRYNVSDKGRERNARFRATPLGHQKRARYWLVKGNNRRTERRIDEAVGRLDPVLQEAFKRDK